MIQSKYFFSSAMTRSTPSAVRLSLSRVCEAGSRNRVSRRLSRISALDHVDQIINDPALGTHDEIEIAQADVEIDDNDLLVSLRKSRSQCGS